MDDVNLKSKLNKIWLIAIVIAAVVPYLSSLRGGFVLDDWELIVRYPLAHSLSNAPKAFLIDFLHGALGDNVPFYYRPLIIVSFQADYSIGGANPFVFRLTNLFLNLLVVLSVLIFARRLTKNDFIAGIAAISYALLPSHAESVSWISGRTDLLSTLFVLTSVIIFAANYDRGKDFSWKLALLSALAFACAIFSKEIGIVVPLLMLAYALTSNRKPTRTDIVRWALILLPIFIFYSILRRNALGTDMEKFILFMIRERFAGIGIAFAAYLRMMFIPQKLKVIYDIFPIGIKYPALAAAAWLIPIGLVALAIWTHKRVRIISFCSIWLFITLLPVTNVFPTIGPVPAERFIYLASVASSIILGYIALHIYQWRPKAIRMWPGLSIALICWFLLYSGLLTFDSSHAYASDISWAREIAASKVRFAQMRNQAAANLFSAGFLKESANEYKATFALADKDDLRKNDYINYALALRLTGQPTEAIDILIEARETLKASADIEFQLGVAYGVVGQYENAAAAFRSATALDPTLGVAWRNLGRAELRMGRNREAITAFERAFKIYKPTDKDKQNLESAYGGLKETGR